MNPNILIVETGSKNNTTEDMLGAFNICKYKGIYTKTATNENVLIKSVFDFKGIIIDCYGHDQKVALLEKLKVYSKHSIHIGCNCEKFIQRIKCVRKQNNGS